MKKLILLLLPALFVSLSCTSGYTVKNKARVLSAEKFDNEVQARAKENFVDATEQKVFADFLKKNSRIEINSFELKGDNEAVGELTVQTFPRTLDPELKKVSGKEWQTKVQAALEKKSYPFTMKKTDVWTITGLPF
jgi:anionic cell wall polymer biosynthesis LytR-Cps2A-Psr (LCP) family protein